LGGGKKIKLDANAAGDLVGNMMTPGLEVKRFGGIGVSNVHEQNWERFEYSSSWWFRNFLCSSLPGETIQFE